MNRIDETLDLKAEIRKLCKEKDAIILAHYYTVGEIQDIADLWVILWLWLVRLLKQKLR